MRKSNHANGQGSPCTVSRQGVAKFRLCRQGCLKEPVAAFCLSYLICAQATPAIYNSCQVRRSVGQSGPESLQIQAGEPHGTRVEAQSE
eukprot:6175385-Pleurochrysis_carterae.AAC.3